MSEVSKLNSYDLKDKTARANHSALVKEVNNFVDEVNLAFEELDAKIGSGGGSAENCVKYTDFAANKVGAVYVTNGSGHGLYCDASNGHLRIARAAVPDIEAKVNDFMPIVPTQVDAAVKAGLVNNKYTLTEEEKEKARDWIGAAGVTEIQTKYVTTDTAQNISGSKVFTGEAHFENNMGLPVISNNGFNCTMTDAGYVWYSANGIDISDTVGIYRLTFPKKNGEIALTSDIPSAGKRKVTFDEFKSALKSGLTVQLYPTFDGVISEYAVNFQQLCACIVCNSDTYFSKKQVHINFSEGSETYYDTYWVEYDGDVIMLWVDTYFLDSSADAHYEETLEFDVLSDDNCEFYIIG